MCVRKTSVRTVYSLKSVKLFASLAKLIYMTSQFAFVTAKYIIQTCPYNTYLFPAFKCGALPHISFKYQNARHSCYK